MMNDGTVSESWESAEYYIAQPSHILPHRQCWGGESSFIAPTLLWFKSSSLYGILYNGSGVTTLIRLRSGKE